MTPVLQPKKININTSETSEKSEYYGSDIYNELGFKSKEEFDTILVKAFETLSSTVSIKQNFKQVFKFESGKMYADWRISPLAYNFLKLNHTEFSK